MIEHGPDRFRQFSGGQGPSWSIGGSSAQPMQLIRKEALVRDVLDHDRRRAIQHRQVGRSGAAVMHNGRAGREDVPVRRFPDLLDPRMVGDADDLVPFRLDDGAADDGGVCVGGECFRA
jgi:hypothetical protein